MGLWFNLCFPSVFLICWGLAIWFWCLVACGLLFCVLLVCGFWTGRRLGFVLYLFGWFAGCWFWWFTCVFAGFDLF